MDNFFQHHWLVIQKDVLKMVEDFIESGYLNQQMNKTLITMVPKVPNLERLDQFRPISLCNFAYKIISNVLANRLKL